MVRGPICVCWRSAINADADETVGESDVSFTPLEKLANFKYKRSLRSFSVESVGGVPEGGTSPWREISLEMLDKASLTRVAAVSVAKSVDKGGNVQLSFIPRVVNEKGMQLACAGGSAF